MSALVFGSPRANAIVNAWKRIDAMGEADKLNHSPQALEEKIRAISEEIRQLERELADRTQRRIDLCNELDSWRLP